MRSHRQVRFKDVHAIGWKRKMIPMNLVKPPQHRELMIRIPSISVILEPRVVPEPEPVNNMDIPTITVRLPEQGQVSLDSDPENVLDPTTYKQVPVVRPKKSFCFPWFITGCY
jgi:hypothetical protein